MFLRLARWLARKLGWHLMTAEAWAELSIRADRAWDVERHARETMRTAEELLEENKQLRAAYDALLEEMEELRNG